jgi:hypothetical protein
VRFLAQGAGNGLFAQHPDTGDLKYIMKNISLSYE